MVQSLGAQVGLLAFAVGLIAGLYAGNDAGTTLIRALLAMIAGAAIGQMAGWMAKLVLRDYLQRKKRQIDREHIEAVRALVAAQSPSASPAPEKAE